MSSLIKLKNTNDKIRFGKQSDGQLDFVRVYKEYIL